MIKGNHEYANSHKHICIYKLVENRKGRIYYAEMYLFTEKRWRQLTRRTAWRQLPVHYTTWGQSWNRSHRLVTWRGKFRPRGLRWDRRATLLLGISGGFNTRFSCSVQNVFLQQTFVTWRLCTTSFYFKLVEPSKLNASFHLMTSSIRLVGTTDCSKYQLRV